MEKNKKKNKVDKKIFGFLLMIAGVALPLYAFFNLSLNQYLSDYKYGEFIEYKKGISNDEILNFKNFSAKYNKKIEDISGNIVDPFDYNEYKNSYGLDVKDRDEIFGYVKIPKIDAVKPIRFDANYQNLSRGVAHVDGTSLPLGGIGTRSVIAGHRGWYTDVMFLNLHKLEKGDVVIVELIDGTTLKYSVKDSEIIAPYEWEKITPIENKDMLTLLTCDPITPPSPYRLIINCERVEETNILAEINIAKTNNEESEKKSVDRTVLLTKYGIYIITLFLIVVLIVLIYKFIKYLCIKRIENKEKVRW